MTKRGKSALTICSTAFKTLGHAQASALRKREEVRAIAGKCVDDIVQLVTKAGAKS